MQQGWVYVLVNSSMPGMAKVGRTIRSPADRIAELSQASGVATPFMLAFDQAFADCCGAERNIHDELDRRGLRVAPNREFFWGSPSDIIRVVLGASDTIERRFPAVKDDSPQLLLAAGDRHLSGTSDGLQDTGEAVRCYRLAAKRGALLAFERLGKIYVGLYQIQSGRAVRHRALALLKEGASRGNYYCFAEMAVLFTQERHLENAGKAWNLFFHGRDTAWNPEAEIGTDRFEGACCRYIASCLALGVQPGHPELLTKIMHGLIALLLTELDHVRSDAPARQAVAASLRWVYTSLPPLPSSEPLRRKRLVNHWGRVWLQPTSVAAV